MNRAETNRGAEVLIDCGRQPLREVLALWGILLASCLAFLIGGIFLAPRFVGIPVLSTILLTAWFAWFTRPKHTLLTRRGIEWGAGNADWAEIEAWEMYNDRRALTLVVRTQLLRLDQLTLEVPLFANQEAAEAVLRARVPNGRVLP